MNNKKILPTHLEAGIPDNTKIVANGYALWRDYIDTNTNIKYYHKEDGVWEVQGLVSAEYLQGQINAINILLGSDNVNLNNVQELVDAIETLQISLDTILVNDLVTGGVTKALTAEMGKQLKELKADDNQVVHKTSTETIGGLKTFTSILTALKFKKSGGTNNQILLADGEVFEKFTQTITSGTQIDTTSKTDVVATGLTVTPPAGTYKVDFNGHYLSIPGNVVQIATIDLQILKLYLGNLPFPIPHGLSFGSGETLTAGVYTVAGQMSVAGVLTLNGGVNDIFVFRADGAINTASFTTIQLTGGVKSANIFFIGNGAVGIGANNTISGNFISVGSAIAFGADAIFDGRLFSTAGAIAFGAGTISKPTDVSPIPMGILDSFLSFTNLGGITNTALAVITGNLGTGSASVTIFTGSVFNGVSFDVTQPFGDTNVFSLYKGDVQIPFSDRKRYFNTYVEDVNLMATVTVDGAEEISVRWRTDVGKVILGNRILTVLKI
jgi:hypothetical protein